MTDVHMIPLTKLVESEDNVRKSSRNGGVGELASSIKSHGLIQSMVVRETANKKYAVIAGGRRLRALRLLAKAGGIEKNAAIPCRIIREDENAAELSLAENIVRADMEAHEELEAFQRLVDAGEGPETIAARFGVSPMHVARRLKLARVSPRLIEALKKGDASLDQLAALAVVDDHAAQESAFFEAPDWARTPERLKAQVCQAHLPETDKLARFVGLDSYREAGGAIVTDLFAEAEDDSAHYLTDRALIVRLAEAKLQPLAEDVRGEGWAWVEIALDGVAWTHFPDRVREQRRPLSDAERQVQDRLLAALDETEDETKIEALETALDALVTTAWAAEEVALAGAIITLTQMGEPKVERGLVKADDAKALKGLRRKQSGNYEGAPDDNAATPGSAAPRPQIPAKLADELMAHKTLALRAEIATQPDLALRCVVLALAADATSDVGPLSLIRVRVEETDVAKLLTRSESKATAAYTTLLDSWRHRLPSNTVALWSFIAQCDAPTLVELLAVLIAPAIELRTGRGGDLAKVLCQAARLDMSKWWSATPQSYFEHVRKDVIIDALLEINPALDRAKLDKAAKKEVLARAKKAFKGRDWLPEMLRASPNAIQEPQAIAAE